MREIEFRGKVLEDDSFFGYKKGQWVFGNYSKDRLYNNIHIEDTSKEDIESIDVDPDTVGQYTGRTDKNGTKIFEGDVLEFEFDEIGKQRAKVYFNEKYGAFLLEVISENFQYANISDGIVIGNIHDNPELLEGL